MRNVTLFYTRYGTIPEHLSEKRGNTTHTAPINATSSKYGSINLYREVYPTTHKEPTPAAPEERDRKKHDGVG